MDNCERQNKPDQIYSGESAVISHEMQFIRPHLLMKRRKMRRDNRSSHTILVSVEGFFCPDAACEVLQKPVLPWELQEQGNTCLNRCGIFQNYILNLPRLHYSLTGMFCRHHWRQNRHPVVHFDLLRILFLLFKSDDCLNCVIVTPRTIS